jgi:replicative DNA helicase
MTNSRIEELKTMPYEEYLKTPEWAEKQANALQRADHRCQICNSPHSLHVHHRTYENRGDEQLENLTVLCDECHMLYHHKDSISHHILSIQDSLEHMSPSKIAGVPTGFTKIDKILGGGLQRGDLVVVASRPSMGKTSLALSIAHKAAKKFKQRVVIFSLEMSAEQVVQRLISAETGIDSQRLRLGQIEDDELQLYVHATGVLSDMPLYIDDTPALSALEMRTKAHLFHAEHGIDLIIVDYLQLMRGGHRAKNRVQEISSISRALKALARELKIPVMAVSQLSRAVESRHDKRPILTDLRESGSLEQDADVVIFIYRDEVYDPYTEQPNIADLLVAKHRNGPTARIPLYFQSELAKFHEVELRYEELEFE